MELTESIETLNQRLIDYYGKVDDGRARWRVVFSADQYEKRYGTFNKFDNSGNVTGQDTGVEIRPKYAHYIHDKYILEYLIFIPEGSQTDLVEKSSYEPIWTFQTKDYIALPPDWDAIVIIIASVNNAVFTKHAGPKYKQSNEDVKQEDLLRKKAIYDRLFGNESPIGDALATDNAVGYGPRKRNDARFKEMKK